jgi:glucose/arabinose dehydrogenase
MTRNLRTVSRRTVPLTLSAVLVLASLTALLTAAPPAARAATLPTGFSESAVLSGLTNPTVVRFARDGRIFVAEKRGVIKVFDSLTDTTPDVFADLNVNVYNFWDRGLLGMALDPNFPASPYVYVLYTYDHVLGSAAAAPRWGTAGVYSDPCPSPPAANTDGCVVSGRLSRLQASGNFMTGGEQVLVEDWCQQFPSHSIGALEFGPDGALYASGGDGASFNAVDYGQYGGSAGSPTLKNPCGDPPSAAGTTLAPPTAEGGALRSQDVRTGGDPASLDGSIIRVSPVTGAALADNPMAASSDANARRIIAHGLRNPFRFTFKPGTSELWAGDVGWNDWEEINRIPSPTDATVENFGWPCYEGPSAQPGYDSANLNLCESLYQAGGVTAPYHAYRHSDRVVPNESCPTGSSSIAGMQFEFAASGNTYPSEYDNALFFADYSRDCIWVMPKGADGRPAPGLVRTFVAGAANPVNLETGPGGDLFYVDFDGGTIRRIGYTATVNQPPTAVATGTPTSGPAPLTVSFNGSGSSDPEGGALTYAWDLNGDGTYNDGTAATATYTYTVQGTYTARLKVTDNAGASATASVVITVGNTPPTVNITTPAAGTTWKVGDVISFSGSATDQQDGTLPASALAWDLTLYHCPSNCHTHQLQSFSGASGSFVTPDHEYPSYLELRLTATDSGGLAASKTLRLDPRTVVLTFQTTPGGFGLVVNATPATATFTRTVIVGSSNSISATTPQTKGGKRYSFQSWSDGGAQTHNIVAPAAPATWTARYRRT